jgi:hypothetical protein
MLRRVTGEITPEFINAAVERLFTAAEVVDEDTPGILENLRYRVCQLYLTNP